MTADEWNSKYPSGTVCIYKSGANLPCFVTTRSEAWTLGSGHAVVLLAGRTGGYALDALEPQPRATPRLSEGGSK